MIARATVWLFRICPRPGGKSGLPALRELLARRHANNPEALVLFVSDAAFDDADSIEGLRMRRVGSDDPNASIVALSEPEVDEDEGSVELEVELLAHGPERVEELRLCRADGATLASVELTLGEGRNARRRLRAPLDEDQDFLYIERAGAADALALDDRVWFGLRREARARLLVVADDPDPWLMAALEVLDEQVDLRSAARAKPAACDPPQRASTS